VRDPTARQLPFCGFGCSSLPHFRIPRRASGILPLVTQDFSKGVAEPEESIRNMGLKGQETQFRISTCPICSGAVPLQVVTLRQPFDCPSCGNSLKFHGGHALVIRLVAVAFGFLVAHGLGGLENMGRCEAPCSNSRSSRCYHLRLRGGPLKGAMCERGEQGVLRGSKGLLLS
jgi:hypothetical protein